MFVFESRVAKFVERVSGMQAITLGPCSFFTPPRERVDPLYLLHEQEHQLQWLRMTAGAALGWVLALLFLDAAPWYSVGIVPTAYYVYYVGEWALWYLVYRWRGYNHPSLKAYDRHSLEQDARRAAGQPLR